jgi:tRNA(fMet)-specific endonuclease VapC
MGIVLDTSVLIAGERRGEGVQAIIQRVLTTHGEQDAALSVVTLVELTHGIYRARSDADRERRRVFTHELRQDMAVVPVTAEIAELAGRIEGEQAMQGVSIAFEDLLIGATALHMNYAVVTLNVRHFQLIPGLTVKQP